MVAVLKPSPSASTDTLRRAEQLDALDGILPFDRRDQLAAILTDDDVATLKHLANEGMGENTLRALASDLAYLEAWCDLATGSPLPWPAPEALLLKFVAHHLWDPVRRIEDPAHGMPAEIQAALRERGLLRTEGPHAPATVRRRLTSWSILTRWRGLKGAFSEPSLKSALRLAVRATGRPRQRKSAKAVTGDVLAALVATCASGSLTDIRDRALLLTAFASGGRRRSESTWLVRHLASFQKQYPDIDIVFDADARLIDFRSDQAIIAIRHSATRTSWPRVQSRRLAVSNMIPVVSPLLIPARCVDAAELLRFPLLHEDSRDLWQSCFAAAGIETVVTRGTVYADGGLVLQAALQGEGIALIDAFLAQHELDAGRLIQPFEVSVSYGAYWLVARSFAQLPGAATAFVEWLVANLSDDHVDQMPSNLVSPRRLKSNDPVNS